MTETCSHGINIINFGKNETISYAVVKIVGTVRLKRNIPQCPTDDTEVIVTSKQTNQQRKIRPGSNNHFKILLQLEEGNNDFRFEFGCQFEEISIKNNSLQSEYTVTPLYIICEGHDGTFQGPVDQKCDIESACNRILLCTQLLQCFSAEKLFENGLGRKTFSIENKCQIFQSKITSDDVAKMSQEELWQNIAREIMTSEISSQKRKYLAFLSCTKYHGELYQDSLKSHEQLLKITDGYIALGGGGLALFGTACLYTWPENFDNILIKFTDETPVDKKNFLDDSCYRGTLGACFSTTLGSVLHELYHTFNLGHTEKGIMGRGFDNIQNFFVMDSVELKSEEIAKNFQNQIEFKEEFEPNKLSERLLNENKRKEYNVIKKLQDDSTILTKSCAVMLCYHKWFNFGSSTRYTLIYDKNSKFIRSTEGIRVVELRSEKDELILYDWTFESKVLKFWFQIPAEVFKDKRIFILVVEDNWGNILKQII
ncbi:uncharacterized protein LOC143191030 [Rhynchophorus ferrugineus]|uniref:Zinc metalloproteinase n=1 Tax=Rhynchophorus ferrugineus TaxID=354439 RepID=A0A834IXS9_RHYFE|nr:hypothetical protein GWI33_001707 [Rhynchophorus ferrugineus]